MADVYRLLWVRDILHLPSAGGGLFSFGRPSFPVKCVRAVGIVVSSDDSSFRLDDGTAVITVRLRAGAPRIAPAIAVEVFGELVAEAGQRLIDASNVATRTDPMFECLRWPDLVHVYKYHYFPTAPPPDQPTPLTLDQNGDEAERVEGGDDAALDAAMLMCSSQASQGLSQTLQVSESIAALARRIEQYVVQCGGKGVDSSVLEGAFASETQTDLKAALDLLQQNGSLYQQNGLYALL